MPITVHSRRPSQNSLQPRMFDYLPTDQGRWHYFDPHLVYPVFGGIAVGLAAFALALVYLVSYILDHLLNMWSHNPTANLVVIEAGTLRFELGCTVQPVPWEWIEEMLISKRDAVNRGFAPAYSNEWWFNNTNHRRLCYAGFRIIPKGVQVVPPGEQTVGVWRTKGNLTTHDTASEQWDVSRIADGGNI